MGKQQAARARELGMTRIALGVPLPMHACLQQLVEQGRAPNMTHFIIEALAKELLALGIPPESLQVPPERAARRRGGGRWSATVKVIENLSRREEAT